MTAETLKPFILPTSNSFNIQKHNPNSKNPGHRHLWILIGLSAALLTLSAAAVYITVWEAARIDTLETEIHSLRKEFNDMKKRYGFDDLDDLDEFEKEYSKNDGNLNNINEDDEDYLDSYEQSGNFLSDHFDDFERDDYSEDDDENDEDEYSSEDDSKKIRIIRAIDVSVYPESKAEEKKTDEKKEEQDKNLKQQKRHQKIKANYNRQAHPYSYSHHKRRPQVKTMIMQRQGKIYPNGNNLAAAHYYMNSTVPGNHPHHAAHMKIPHDGDIYIGAPHPWARRYDAHNHFEIEHGLVKVKENGVYFVYSQVLYENNFDKNGYRVYHNDYPFLQCALTIPNNMTKSNTCYTSGVIYLQSGDLLHMRDLFKGRTVALKSAKSFFGIVKLASD